MSSITLVLCWKDAKLVSLYWTGDSVTRKEESLANGYCFLPNTVVSVHKLSHHGSGGSTPKALLEKLNPLKFVVSASSDYKHPHSTVINRVAEHIKSFVKPRHSHDDVAPESTESLRLWVMRYPTYLAIEPHMVQNDDLVHKLQGSRKKAIGKDIDTVQDIEVMLILIDKARKLREKTALQEIDEDIQDSLHTTRTRLDEIYYFRLNDGFPRLFGPSWHFNLMKDQYEYQSTAPVKGPIFVRHLMIVLSHQPLSDEQFLVYTSGPTLDFDMWDAMGDPVDLKEMMNLQDTKTGYLLVELGDRDLTIQDETTFDARALLDELVESDVSSEELLDSLRDEHHSDPDGTER